MTTVIGSVYIYFSCRLYPCLSSVRTRSDLLHQLQWAIHPTSHPHAPPLSSSLSWERSTPFGPRSPPPIKRVVSSIDDIFSPFCLRQFQKKSQLSCVYKSPLYFVTSDDDPHPRILRLIETSGLAQLSRAGARMGTSGGPAEPVRAYSLRPIDWRCHVFAVQVRLRKFAVDLEKRSDHQGHFSNHSA